MLVGILLLLATLGLIGYLVFLFTHASRNQRKLTTQNEQRTDYDDIGPYREGIAIVTKRIPKDHWGNAQDRFGYINADGERITYIRYSEARPFAEGRAFVRLAEFDTPRPKGGFIDETGQEVIPSMYLEADQFRNGLCLVQTEDGVGFIDRAGQMQGVFHYLHFQPLGDNDLFPVSILNIHKTEALDPLELWGYVDTAGREVVRPQFSAAMPFRAGYAIVSQIEPIRFQTRQGVIDPTGQIVLPLAYVAVMFLENGVVDVTGENGKSDVIRLS